MLGAHAEQREHGLGLSQKMCAMIDGMCLVSRSRSTSFGSREKRAHRADKTDRD